MKVHKIFMMLGDYQFLFRMEGETFSKSCSFDPIQRMPNVPFHLRLWEDEKNPIILKDFVKNEVLDNSSIIHRWLKSELYILLPDDTLMIEQKALEEYLMQYVKPKMIKSSHECLYMSSDADTYISITETSRMLVVTAVRQKQVYDRGYLVKMPYEVDAFKKKVGGFADLGSYREIYLHGASLQPFSSLGTMITDETLMVNFMRRNKNS